MAAKKKTKAKPKPKAKAKAPAKKAGKKVRRNTNAQFVDGFVLPVPKKHLADYRRMARAAGKIWLEHGALEFRETAGADMKAKGCKSFPQLAKTKTGETVVFSWIVFKNRQHRNEVNKAVMKDKRIHRMMEKHKDAPFDMKRMAYGGFETIVDLG